MDWLAQELGVSVDSLRRLELGWNDPIRAFSFPIRRPTGQAVGIATRSVRGDKRTLFGPQAVKACSFP